MSVRSLLSSSQVTCELLVPLFLPQRAAGVGGRGGMELPLIFGVSDPVFNVDSSLQRCIPRFQS